MSRFIFLAFVAAAALSGCDDGSVDGSYIYPAAITGIPVQSRAEATNIQALVAEFGKQHDLHAYRPSDQPPFPGTDGDAERQRGITYYEPSQPAYTDGFQMRIWALSA